MTLYLVDDFSVEMLGIGQHHLTFRTIRKIEAADLLYVHEHQTINALEPEFSSLVEAKLRGLLDTLVLPKPQHTRVWLGQYDSVIVAQYIGPKSGSLSPEADISFWFINPAMEFRYLLWHRLTMAYGDATYDFRQKLGQYAKLPLRPTSEDEEREMMYWHRKGLDAMMQEAVEVGARPLETLEALIHIHATLW